ncbi:peptide chain release factor N(5)-glutamine methyltransferase [Marinobacter sp.]|uniref:peptide chain release factor N(5)-glutamine methyltransferase n=1 Tax=Marinobacter sp. TaxID=50741 RepID=UPI0039AFFE8C
MTCEALVRQAAREIGGESPRLDAELLMEHVTGWSRTSQRAWPERAVSDAQRSRFDACVAQRKAGRPVAHILGSQSFWSLSLQVNDTTLIPRPDTECLVEAALALPLPVTAKVLDLGTGTGAIALALASERPGWRVVASDAAPGAVALARANARSLGLPVTVLASHWFEALPAQQFDLILANPPYIAEGDRHLAEGDVRFEPRSALVAGTDGLDDLRLIIAEAPQWLAAGGWLMVEHGYDQAAAVRALFAGAGFVAVASGEDYGGNERYTLGRQSL